jgi:hypothetical protein
VVDASTEELERLSKRLLNSKHRFHVAVALKAVDGLVDRDHFADEIGLPRTGVLRDLQWLVEVGAAQRVESGGRVYFQLRHGPFWPWLESVLTDHGTTPTEAPATADQLRT